MKEIEDIPLSRAVIGAAIEVHRCLGPGLLESAYESFLAHELTLRNIPFQRQYSIPVTYKGLSVDCGFKIDLWVDHQIIVELKAVDALAPIHEAQILTYMKLTECRVGLLMNFNVRRLTSGLKRFLLDLPS